MIKEVHNDFYGGYTSYVVLSKKYVRLYNLIIYYNNLKRLNGIFLGKIYLSPYNNNKYNL